MRLRKKDVKQGRVVYADSENNFSKTRTKRYCIKYKLISSLRDEDKYITYLKENGVLDSPHEDELTDYLYCGYQYWNVQKDDDKHIFRKEIHFLLDSTLEKDVEKSLDRINKSGVYSDELPFIDYESKNKTRIKELTSDKLEFY